jgi:hypothetical protein
MDAHNNSHEPAFLATIKLFMGAAIVFVAALPVLIH